MSPRRTRGPGGAPRSPPSGLRRRRTRAPRQPAARSRAPVPRRPSAGGSRAGSPARACRTGGGDRSAPSPIPAPLRPAAPRRGRPAAADPRWGCRAPADARTSRRRARAPTARPTRFRVWQRGRGDRSRRTSCARCRRCRRARAPRPALRRWRASSGVIAGDRIRLQRSGPENPPPRGRHRPGGGRARSGSQR